MKEFDFKYVKEHFREAQSGKLVQTRKGDTVKLLSVNCRGKNPIVGVVVGENTDVATSWNAKGVNWAGDKDDDLVMKPVKKEGWVNVYNGIRKPYCGSIYATKEETLKEDRGCYITTIKIEWEE